MKQHKISICTVCMNRLHHVRQTLKSNIEANEKYSKIEFVLLDYNSSDGLEEWVNDDMKDYLDSGVLKYYRTEDPAFFDRTHSRNMMFRLATGDIICNVDADNFSGENFASYVNEEFNKNSNVLIVADTKKRYYFLRNAFGRFACLKDDYFEVRGMDETMKSYGSETLDLYERLQALGREEVVIKNTNFLKAISHDDEERIENEYFLKNIERFYIRFESYDSSELIFLFKDGQYEKCQIIPERVETHLPATLKEDSLEKGTWSINDDILSLGNDHAEYHIKEQDITEIGSPDTSFLLVTDQSFLNNVAKNYSFIVNNETLKDHKVSKTTIVNPISFGEGTVIQNSTTTLSLS